MGYAVKSTLKDEKKQGYAAVEALLADDQTWSKPAILAYARLHKDEFAKYDELDDADFCQKMDFLRTSDLDKYRIFWWWRKANADAAKQGEEDADIIKEPAYRQFTFCQFRAKPWSDDWEDDRSTLKPGVIPLITDRQIEDGLAHGSIKEWAWVWHTRDVYTEKDEITDRSGRIKANQKKFDHVHVVIRVSPARPISTIARWFNVPPNIIKVLRGAPDYKRMIRYLPHETADAISEGKTHYDDDEIHASPGFDFRKLINTLKEREKKYGAAGAGRTDAEVMRDHVLTEGWTMRQCSEDDPITFAKIYRSLPGLRLNYLRNQPPAANRLTIYVEGDSGSGKTAFCRLFARDFFSDYDDPYFEAGRDARVTFEGYDGQPCVIWNETRPERLIQAFGYDGVYDMLETYPGKESYQRKGSSVILNNRLTLINGIMPWREFIQKLMEPGRPPKQIYRRLQMIIVIHPEDYDIVLSAGFLDRSREYNDYIEYKRIRGSIPRLLQTLEANAKEVVAHRLLREPVEKLKMLQDAFGDKIADPEAIPAEFDNYGTMPTEEELQAEAEAIAAKKMKAAAQRISDFGHWFWREASVFAEAWHICPTLVLDDHLADRYQYLRHLNMILLDEDDPESFMPAIDAADEDDSIPALTWDGLDRAVNEYLTHTNHRDDYSLFMDNRGAIVDALLAGLVGPTSGAKRIEQRAADHKVNVKMAKRLIAETEYKEAIAKAVKSPNDRPYIIPTEDPDVYYVRSTPQTKWEKEEAEGIPHTYDPNSPERNY